MKFAHYMYVIDGEDKSFFSECSILRLSTDDIHIQDFGIFYFSGVSANLSDISARC